MRFRLRAKAESDGRRNEPRHSAPRADPVLANEVQSSKFKVQGFHLRGSPTLPRSTLHPPTLHACPPAAVPFRCIANGVNHAFPQHFRGNNWCLSKDVSVANSNRENPGTQARNPRNRAYPFLSFHAASFCPHFSAFGSEFPFRRRPSVLLFL